MPIYKDNIRDTWYFDIRYRDSSGKVRSIKRRGFDTEQKAKNAEKKMLKEMTSKDLPSNSKSLREIGLEYIESMRHDLKEQSYNANIYKVNTFIPNKKISSITPKKALEWRNELADLRTASITKKDGDVNPGKSYSTKYKNEIIALYKSIFRYAMKMEYVHRDVSYDLSNYKKQYEDTIQYTVITKDEFFEKWNSLPEKTGTNKIFKMFVLLAFSTGARRAELKGLTFNDYDGKGISINKSVTGKDSDRNKIDKTKTKASLRYVELDQYTINCLNEYIAYWKSVKKINSKHFLFGFETAFPNNTIQTNFKKMGLDCRFHDLRHSHATLLIQNGVPINVVSRRLGHSTVEMTLKVYTHIFEQSQNQAVSVLNNLFTNQ